MVKRNVFLRSLITFLPDRGLHGERVDRLVKSKFEVLLLPDLLCHKDTAQSIEGYFLPFVVSIWHNGVYNRGVISTNQSTASITLDQ